jgi:hypothetical protein
MAVDRVRGGYPWISGPWVLVSMSGFCPHIFGFGYPKTSGFRAFFNFIHGSPSGLQRNEPTSSPLTTLYITLSIPVPDPVTHPTRPFRRSSPALARCRHPALAPSRTPTPPSHTPCLALQCLHLLATRPLRPSPVCCPPPSREPGCPATAAGSRRCHPLPRTLTTTLP